MKDPTNWSKLQKETSEEFVDKLLLYVRTNNFEAFCFAVDCSAADSSTFLFSILLFSILIVI